MRCATPAVIAPRDRKIVRLGAAGRCEHPLVAVRAHYGREFARGAASSIRTRPLWPDAMHRRGVPSPIGNKAAKRGGSLGAKRGARIIVEINWHGRFVRHRCGD